MTKWNLNKSFSHLCRGPSLTNRNHEHELAHYNVCPRYLKKTHSLDHMFLRCSSVVNCLWRTFQIWWTDKNGQTLTLSDSMILYGVFNNTQHRYSLNYALLIAKFSEYTAAAYKTKRSLLTVFSYFFVKS